MSELAKIAEAWSSRPEAARKGALATVLRTHGSTFRRPGARMVVFKDGSTVGSVSGGCLEGSIIECAAEVMRTGKSQSLRYDGARDDVVLGEGAMCDGEVAINVEKIDEELSRSLVRLATEGHDSDVSSRFRKRRREEQLASISSCRRSHTDTYCCRREFSLRCSSFSVGQEHSPAPWRNWPRRWDGELLSSITGPIFSPG